VDIDTDDLRQEQRGLPGEVAFVSAFALVLSIIAFAWFYYHGDILLYGDAVAHINIARRITDARNAGWDQIGTVWLPFPHLLVAPFVANDWLWRTGIGGSVPSMLAYVLGVAGIFRLVRTRASFGAASLAAAIYALNPSMLYMQATAMTESIFLAAVVWALVYFDEFLRGLSADAPGAFPVIPAWRAIERCGVCLAAGIFTRYDGWIIAFIIGMCVVFAAFRWFSIHPSEMEIGRLVRSMFSFFLLLALCPTLWLAHNYKSTHQPFDWLNGPYSAKAIEKRSSSPGAPPYPGKNHMGVAAQYFLKSARMNTGEGSRQNWLIILASIGAIIAAINLRRFAPFFLLWIPLPFYAYSVAYGSVPIFLPEWWPFSYYNVRYGLELLPAIAVFAGLLPWAISRLHRRTVIVYSTWALLVIVLLAFNSSAWCFSKRSQDRYWGRKWMIPLCYREAWANSRGRFELEAQVAHALAGIPKNATVLMYTSEYVGALQKAGIHLDRVISEATYEGWDVALASPSTHADYVVAVDGDEVAKAILRNPRGLTKFAAFHTADKPDVTIYQSSNR
jgi:hypothetical protein